MAWEAWVQWLPRGWCQILKKCAWVTSGQYNILNFHRDRFCGKLQSAYNPFANAGHTRDAGSIPSLGRSPGVRNGNPLQNSCVENSWTEEPGGLHPIGLQRIGQDWSDLARMHVLWEGLFDTWELESPDVLSPLVCHFSSSMFKSNVYLL